MFYVLYVARISYVFYVAYVVYVSEQLLSAFRCSRILIVCADVIT